MDKEIIKTAMQFMMRVDLKGQEVPAFNAVMNAMQDELSKPSTCEHVLVKPTPGAMPAGETATGEE